MAEFNSSSSDDDLDLESLESTHRRPRIFRERINFSRLPDGNISRFRFNDDVLKSIIDRVHLYLEHPTSRNYALTSRQQVMVALRFLSTGDNFTTIADSHGIHKSTVSRTIHRFVYAVNEHLFNDIVRFDGETEIQTRVQNFF